MGPRAGARFGGKAKSSLLVIAATGSLAFYASSSSSDDDDLPGVSSPLLSAALRSFRAISTVALTVVDYKSSLRGLPPGSDDYSSALSQVHLRSAKRFLELCEINRGFYVKAGQFVAAMRQAPKEYVSTLSSLQDKAVPCDFESIRAVLLLNFGRDLSEIFSSFDEQPTAAASIAQVHHAVLKDGREVAVKVQYPGLERQMKLDMMTMSLLSKTITRLFPDYRFDRLVQEFTQALTQELDFNQEGKNSERTAHYFRNNYKVRIPKVHWESTTKQVLTMEFCKGTKVDDVEQLEKMGVDPQKVAHSLVEVFAEMIFVHGFVHGDPHPGNILVSSKGQGGFVLVLLDHGIYKQLDERFRHDFCQLWKSLILLNSAKVQSKSSLGKGMTDKEKRSLKKELRALTMEDISLFMESLPPDFIMVLRTDALLRSIVRKLGAPQRIRHLTYVKFASFGLHTRLRAPSDSALQYAISNLEGCLDYFRLRFILEMVELIRQLEKTRHSFFSWLRKHIMLVLQYPRRTAVIKAEND
ncbi:hypothetical protein MLD38_013384 [Melastoma candidum]|uniref:Uncharacterized protein n=1 Tax=Melastoma candidum TaxID=119954 RepID=A0ACB9R8T5_9MYRT|nr:hypothetical protein MLD38_013384 [Melastoma candidum]